MSLVETIAQWQESGELRDEYDRLQRILAQRKYGRERIQYCFSMMLTGIGFAVVDKDTNELQLEPFRRALDDFLKDEVDVIETCGEFVDLRQMPARELSEHVQRMAGNRVWQAGDDVDGAADRD